MNPPTIEAALADITQRLLDMGRPFALVGGLAVSFRAEVRFTPYRKVMDEIQQAREYGDAKWAQSKAEGHKSGLAEGKRDTLIPPNKRLMRDGASLAAHSKIARQ